MLREAWSWLRTPCSREARRLGYLAEAIAFESRRWRCGAAWAEHIEHCHSAVGTSLQRCSRHRTALVMGSGLALEYPLDTLAASFDCVILADIVHLPAVRKLAARYGNVVLHDVDLCGIARPLLRSGASASAASIESWGETTRSPFDTLHDIDWVLSANVLTQLPLLPVAWLARRNPAADDAGLEHLGRTLMQQHLDLLSRFDGERLLLTDAEHTVRDAAGNIVEHSDFADALGLDHHSFSTWNWAVAPRGELKDNWTRTHRVVACHWPAGR